MDGCEDDYLNVAIARGRMPHLARMAEDGYRGLVRAALPTYTNVNNACIVSGVPPSVTGISGNFFLDPGSGAEVMMNSGRYLRCDTILAAAARSGRKVAMVTAKEKLRDLLTRGLQGIAFSSERAAEQIRDLPGLEYLEETVREGSPDIYSAEASLFVLRAGVVGIPSERWGETPLAVIVLQQGEDATADEITNFCRDNMAHFKAPKSVIFGPLPKTSTGKIQKFKMREQSVEELGLDEAARVSSA